MTMDQQLYSYVQPDITNVILTSSHGSLVNHHNIISDVITTS